MTTQRSFIACAALCVISGAAAAQTVTLYGAVDLNLHRVSNTGVGSISSMTNSGLGSSRFGVRGSEDLGGGNSAVFTLESEVLADTGQAGNMANAVPVPAGQFWSRMAWVGLRSQSLGELRLGRDYTPVFLTVAGYDPFGHLGIGSIGNMLFSSQTVAISAAFGPSSAVSANTTVRTNNSVGYISPSIGGFSVQGMVAAGEGASSTGPTGNSKLESLRAGYDAGPISLSASFATTHNTLVAGQSFKEAAVGASYDFGVVKLMGEVVQLKLDQAKSTVGLLGVTVPLGVGLLRASVIRTNQSGRTTAGASIDDRDATQLALGYVHNRSKRTALYATASRIANKGSNAGFAVPGGPAFAAGSDRKSTGLEAGVRHLF